MKGDSEAYKEMFEMGQRLQDLARECGYNPDGEETEESAPEMYEDDGAEAIGQPLKSSQKRNKMDIAMSMFRNGR